MSIVCQYLVFSLPLFLAFLVLMFKSIVHQTTWNGYFTVWAYTASQSCITFPSLGIAQYHSAWRWCTESDLLYAYIMVQLISSSSRSSSQSSYSSYSHDSRSRSHSKSVSHSRSRSSSCTPLSRSRRKMNRPLVPTARAAEGFSPSFQPVSPRKVLKQPPDPRTFSKGNTWHELFVGLTYTYNKENV